MTGAAAVELGSAAVELGAAAVELGVALAVLVAVLVAFDCAAGSALVLVNAAAWVFAAAFSCAFSCACCLASACCFAFAWSVASLFAFASSAAAFAAFAAFAASTSSLFFSTSFIAMAAALAAAALSSKATLDARFFALEARFFALFFSRFAAAASAFSSSVFSTAAETTAAVFFNESLFFCFCLFFLALRFFRAARSSCPAFFSAAVRGVVSVVVVDMLYEVCEWCVCGSAEVEVVVGVISGGWPQSLLAETVDTLHLSTQIFHIQLLKTGSESVQSLTMSGKTDEGSGGGKTSEPVNEGKTSPAREESASAGGKTTENFDKQNDAGETLMDRVMAYCRTRDFLKTFEDYILNHLKFFKDAELDEGGEPEHRLEWYDIFQDYLKVFEGVMEEFIEREGGDFNAFYQECRVKQDDGTPHEKVSALCSPPPLCS